MATNDDAYAENNVGCYVSNPVDHIPINVIQSEMNDKSEDSKSIKDRIATAYQNSLYLADLAKEYMEYCKLLEHRVFKNIDYTTIFLEALKTHSYKRKQELADSEKTLSVILKILVHDRHELDTILRIIKDEIYISQRENYDLAQILDHNTCEKEILVKSALKKVVEEYITINYTNNEKTYGKVTWVWAKLKRETLTFNYTIEIQLDVKVEDSEQPMLVVAESGTSITAT
jgi:hypothetical protein